MLQFKCFRGKYGVRVLHQSQKHRDALPEPSESMPLRGITSRALAQKHVTFRGTCYLCQYTAHSQMRCPLRFCRACKTYGHSEAVCTRFVLGTTASRRSGGKKGREDEDPDALAEWD